jgi:hypothetical protein
MEFISSLYNHISQFYKKLMSRQSSGRFQATPLKALQTAKQPLKFQSRNIQAHNLNRFALTRYSWQAHHLLHMYLKHHIYNVHTLITTKL